MNEFRSNSVNKRRFVKSKGAYSYRKKLKSVEFGKKRQIDKLKKTKGKLKCWYFVKSNQTL